LLQDSALGWIWEGWGLAIARGGASPAIWAHGFESFDGTD
jgi:hypothetical protein